MKLNSLFNNEIIGIYSILIYLKKAKVIELEKYLLLLPILLNDDLVKFIKSKSTKTRSIQELCLKKYDLLVNFNFKYYDLVETSINCLELLSDLEYIKIKENKIILNDELDYRIVYNRRLKNIETAIDEIVELLNIDTSSLYFELRVMI